MKIIAVSCLMILSTNMAFANGPSVVCTSGGSEPKYVVEILRAAQSGTYSVKLKKRAMLGGTSRWIVTPLMGKLDLTTPAPQQSIQLFGRNESGIQHFGSMSARPQFEDAQSAQIKFDQDSSVVNLPACTPLVQ